jgi:glycosyltransferase involved in cell wall biosynthesis
MEAISELFDSTTLTVPCQRGVAGEGLAPLVGRKLQVVPLSAPSGNGIVRKLRFPAWLMINMFPIWREVRRADAVHAPIPGDIGTIGMLFALLLRKPLFVRHCGNWLVQRTAAERFWKWSMEFFGGGRNVMLATGGNSVAPSTRNPNVKWIFSTSLRRGQMNGAKPKGLPRDGSIRLVIACRQEEGKGTDVVIEAMPKIRQAFPMAKLDVIGDGSLLPKLKQRAAELGVDGSIKFHGKLEHSSVLRVLGEAHLMCYPTSASEGFPKVVLEALANGIPVITTKVSVLPQLIGRRCGVLIDSASADELATSVVGVCFDKARYSEMSERALEVSKQYCLEDWREFIGRSLRDAWGVSLLSEEVEAGG